MNILIDIAHPAHVHVTRNVYNELIKRGHKVYVTVKDIPSAVTLLDIYKIPYIHLGGKKDSLYKKALLQIMYNLKIWWLVVTRNIHVGFSSSITPAHISRITKMRSILIDDDDDAVEPLFVKWGHAFADFVLSPACIIRSTNKLVSYNGYHELAYLHPNRFTPDASVLTEIGVKEGEKYFVLRFNAFKAHHDVGVCGLSKENKWKIIRLLENKGRVFITTEREIDPEFSDYQLRLSPEKIHSLLYYATMLIGDSQTMTSEAAVLGTPAIRSNTFVGRLACLEEEEHKYELTYGFLPEDYEAMQARIEELLALPNLKEVWEERRKRMLADKIDVTDFFVKFIEGACKK